MSIPSSETFSIDGIVSNVSCIEKPSLPRIFSRVASVRVRRSFTHLKRIYGLVTQVWFPNEGTYDPDTRQGSIYNREGKSYRYNEDPDLPCEIVVYSNLATLSSFDSQTFMDQLSFATASFGYTDRSSSDNMCLIRSDSKIKINFSSKDFYFFIKKVTTLEAYYPSDGKVIHKLHLESYI